MLKGNGWLMADGPWSASKDAKAENIAMVRSLSNLLPNLACTDLFFFFFLFLQTMSFLLTIIMHVYTIRPLSVWFDE